MKKNNETYGMQVSVINAYLCSKFKSKVGL